MQRDRADALLRREVGEKAAKLLDGKNVPPTWRGRPQTIALLRERVRALHEQYAGAGAAAKATQPAGSVANAAQSDAPPTAGPAALPVAAPRDRHDMQHRAHLTAMRSSAQVKLFMSVMLTWELRTVHKLFRVHLTCCGLQRELDVARAEAAASAAALLEERQRGMASAARRRTVESEARLCMHICPISSHIHTFCTATICSPPSSGRLFATVLVGPPCVQARVLRAKTTLLEETVAGQAKLLASFKSPAATIADPALAALAATHWPADAKASVSALEAHTANLLVRIGEREARIKHLEETALLQRAQLSAPLVREGRQAPTEDDQAAAGSHQGTTDADSQSQ